MRRLLVVEDDARLRDELCVLLERNGYEAAAITDFGDVAAQILAAAPDLVLLDLNLPGVDGQYVCREVRRRIAQGEKLISCKRAEECDTSLCTPERVRAWEEKTGVKLAKTPFSR